MHSDGRLTTAADAGVNRTLTLRRKKDGRCFSNYSVLVAMVGAVNVSAGYHPVERSSEATSLLILID